MSASHDKRIGDGAQMCSLSFELRAIGELEPPRLTVYKDIGRTMPVAMLKLRFPARAVQTLISLKRSAKYCFKAEVVELADTPS